MAAKLWRRPQVKTSVSRYHILNQYHCFFLYCFSFLFFKKNDFRLQYDGCSFRTIGGNLSRWNKDLKRISLKRTKVQCLKIWSVTWILRTYRQCWQIVLSPLNIQDFILAYCRYLMYFFYKQCVYIHSNIEWQEWCCWFLFQPGRY